MADIFDKAKRSCIMSLIKNKNTAPELNIRKELYSRGLRYTLHNKELPGTPDIVFNKYKAVIFINGCFWHQHSCKAAKLPQSNKDFWEKKLKNNLKRDEKILKNLKDMGWRTKVIWSCELKNKTFFKNQDDADKIFNWIMQN